MVQITDKNSNTFQFDLLINNVSLNKSPFKEIFKRDISGINYIDKDKKVSLENALMLKINFNKVGVFYFYLDSKEIQKDEIIEEIRTLKNMEINSLTVLMDKIARLFKIVEKNNLLFTLFQPGNEYPLDIGIYSTLNLKSPIFVVEKEVEPVNEANEQIKKDEPNKDKKEKTNIKIPKFLIQIKDFFLTYKQDPLYFIFSFISGVLVGFTASFGVYNAFDKKAISVFFFACAGIGVALGGIIQADAQKKENKSKAFIALSVLLTFIGTIVSMIGIVIFYYTKKEIPENMPPLFGIAAFTITISMIALIIAQLIGILIAKKDKNK